MSRYLAFYRCELCGETFAAAEAGDRETAQKAALYASMGEQLQPQGPMLCDIHICDNGNIGIAKFLGFKKGADDA